MNNKEKQLIKQQIETAESTEEILEIINNIVEVKEKRIQELEEELKNRTDNTAKLIEVTNLYLNSISKQEAKNKLEELKKEYEIALEENSTKAFILKCQIDILEEILKGEK